MLAGSDTLLIDKATGTILSCSRIEYDDVYWSVLDGEIDIENGMLVIEYTATKLIFTNLALRNGRLSLPVFAFSLRT